jgi:hypothetical protein
MATTWENGRAFDCIPAAAAASGDRDIAGYRARLRTNGDRVMAS